MDQELPTATPATAEITPEDFRDSAQLTRALTAHFSEEEGLKPKHQIQDDRGEVKEEDPDGERQGDIHQEIEDSLEYLGEHYPENEMAEFEYDRNDYIVIRTETMAENIARARIREDLESEPEIFNQDFIKQHLIVRSGDKHLLAGEEADAEFDDKSEEDILEEFGSDDQKNEAKALEAKGDTAALNKLLQSVKDSAYDERYEAIKEELENPIKYFVEDRGMYTLPQLYEASFITIDYEKAAEAALRTDGWAHFLATYDGDYEALPDGMVVYRV